VVALLTMVHMQQVSGNDIQDEGCGHKILFVLLACESVVPQYSSVDPSYSSL